MLLRIIKYCDLNKRKLMDVYAESNYENTEYFFPDESNKETAVQKVEAGFMDYLKDEFFSLNEAAYWILEENDVWCSALRTCKILNGSYYLEALETRPDLRGKGYGAKLLSGVLNALEKDGPFRLCDCVSKKNVASLKTHEKCGFHIVSEKGYDYLQQEADDHSYGLEYRYSIEEKMEDKAISVRDFEEGDLPLMLKWLTDDRVLEYYEGRDVRFTMDTLAAHYLEELPLGFRVILEFDHIPIGYGQAYRLSGELFDEYDYPDNGRIVYAMDQFIGEPEYWNKGIGSSFLKMMADHLKKAKAADVILLDPHKNNDRVIRAYEKAGFRIIKSLPKHELFEGKMEDCWLMELVL
ncbi:MAG: GNAT family N-acetyltransferase [Firmicutes bacterium]|nr:GNAT family N-acetyltransferase [Bacillota bacterium]